MIDKNNWDKDNVYTVGDEVNDVEMLQEFNGYLIDKKTNNFNLKKVTSFKEVVEILNEGN